MGKASRNKRERRNVPPATHEPAVPVDWPNGHVSVAITDEHSSECIAVTVHGVVHYLHATTAQALSSALDERLSEWDRSAKSAGAPGLQGDDREQRSEVFDPSELADELAQARADGKRMISGALEALRDDGPIFKAHLAFFGFVERAQAFHQGVVDMVEDGNPLAAITLLRSFGENVAAVFYVQKHPHEFEKLQPGATQGLPMGRVVAEAEKSLPGFKKVYDQWSSVAHPSGAGAFHTLRASEGRNFTWQSHPTFHHIDDARQTLRWLADLREITTLIIARTAAVAGADVERSRDRDPG